MKVSCLMLTYNRFKQLKNAISDYISQDYGDKELIIVNSGNEAYQKKVLRFLSLVGDVSIKHICSIGGSLGYLRNVGIEHSVGQFIMIFDDDDRHGCSRITHQLFVCLRSNVQGTMLRNFTAIKHKYFGKQSKKCTIVQGLEGTLLFKKSSLRYTDMDMGEDTKFIHILRTSNHKIVIIDSPYDMYEYHFNGKNTVGKKHFDMMVENNPPMN